MMADLDYPEVDIAPVVFFAYTDITATASRALLSLEGDRVYQSLPLPMLAGASPACVLAPNSKNMSKNNPLEAVQVINCRYRQKRMPQYTFLILNTHVPCAKMHHVVRAIVNLCCQRHVMKLVVLSSQRLDIENRSHLFENPFNGTTPVSQRHPLPGDTIIMDAFLSILIQLCMVEGQPFTLLTAPAHRCTPGQVNKEDGSLQLVRLFQNTITDYSGLMFSEKFSTSLVYLDGSAESQSALMYA